MLPPFSGIVIFGMLIARIKARSLRHLSNTCPTQATRALHRWLDSVECPATIDEYKSFYGLPKNALGWTCFGSIRSCVYTINVTVNYPEARECCERMGTELSKILSADEQRLIYGKFGFYVWTGLNDIKKEGTFVWNDETEKVVSPQFTKWGVTSPHDGSSGRGRNCVATHRQFWKDFPCGWRFRAMCRRILPKPTRGPSIKMSADREVPLPGDMIHIICEADHGQIKWDKRYGGDIRESNKIFTVSTGCELKGRSILRLKVSSELNGTRIRCCVQDLFNNSHQLCNKSPLLLVQKDKSRFTSECPSDVKSIIEQNAAENRNCEAVKWGKDPGISPCGPHWKFDSFSLTCVMELPKPLTWGQAFACCKTVDAKLVKITSSELENYIKETFHLKDKRTWIGLNALKKRGLYVWNDEEKGASYLNWDWSLAGKVPPGKECVIKEREPSEGWTNAFCMHSYAALCSRQFTPRYEHPVMDGNLDGSNPPLYPGDMLNVTCRGNDSQIRWNDSFESQITDEITAVEADEFHNCHRTHRSSRSIRVDHTLDGRRLRCCLTFPMRVGKESFCDESATISVMKETTTGKRADYFNYTGFRYPGNLTDYPEGFEFKKPNLVLDYDAEPSTIYLGGQLTATCQAEVPTQDGITWGIVSMEKWIKLDGNDIWTSISSSVNSCEHRPWFQADSFLQMFVHQNLEGTHLACFSLDVSRTTPLEVLLSNQTWVSLSLALEVTERPPDEDNTNGSALEDDLYDGSDNTLTFFYIMTLVWAVCVTCGVVGTMFDTKSTYDETYLRDYGDFPMKEDESLGESSSTSSSDSGATSSKSSIIDSKNEISSANGPDIAQTEEEGNLRKSSHVSLSISKK